MPSKIRYSYYLPVLDLQAGEADLASQAQAIYTRLGLDRKYCHRYDGVSIFSKPDGQLMVRVSLQNFFNDRVDVRMLDLPYLPSAPMFTCGFCGGEVNLRYPDPDRDFRLVRKNKSVFYIPIPFDVRVPKCGKCGELYLGQTDSDRLDIAMGADIVGEYYWEV